MGDLPNATSAPLADPRWLKTTRASAGGLLALVLAFPFWVRYTDPQGGCIDGRIIFHVASCLVAAPYVIMSAHLARKQAVQIKKGLAWAVGAGAFWGVVGLIVGYANLASRSFGDAAADLLWTAGQVTLATCAIKTYYSTRRAKGDGHILTTGVMLLGASLVFLAMIVFALPDFLHDKQQGRQSSVVQAMRQINAAQETYARTYGKGYSKTLSALQPPGAGGNPSESAAGLIDRELAQGAKWYYTFQYAPGARDTGGKISHYTLTATPGEGGCAHWRRYFTDQSATIHATGEDRLATANDPAL